MRSAHVASSPLLAQGGARVGSDLMTSSNERGGPTEDAHAWEHLHPDTLRPMPLRHQHSPPAAAQQNIPPRTAAPPPPPPAPVPSPFPRPHTAALLGGMRGAALGASSKRPPSPTRVPMRRPLAFRQIRQPPNASRRRLPPRRAATPPVLAARHRCHHSHPSPLAVPPPPPHPCLRTRHDPLQPAPVTPLAPLSPPRIAAGRGGGAGGIIGRRRGRMSRRAVRIHLCGGVCLILFPGKTDDIRPRRRRSTAGGRSEGGRAPRRDSFRGSGAPFHLARCVRRDCVFGRLRIFF